MAPLVTMICLLISFRSMVAYGWAVDIVPWTASGTVCDRVGPLRSFQDDHHSVSVLRAELNMSNSPQTMEYMKNPHV